MVPRAEEDQAGRTHGLGKMGRSRVVRECSPGKPAETLERSPGELGPDMDPGGERSEGGGKGLLLLPVGQSSQTEHMEALSKEATGNLGKAVRRPVLGPGPRAAEKDPVTPFQNPLFGQEIPRPVQVFFFHGQSRGVDPLKPPQSADQVGDPVPGQGKLDRRTDGHGVNMTVQATVDPGALVDQTHSKGGSGKKGDNPGAGSPGKEVDHQIVTLASDLQKKFAITPKARKKGLLPGRKRKSPVKAGLLPQKGVVRGAGQIIDPGPRIELPEGGDGPRREDDIAQAPKTDQKNLPDRGGRGSLQGRPSPAVARGMASSTSITGMSSRTG